MNFRRMGRSGLKGSSICLGTMTFGRHADGLESTRMVDLALDSGVNFFDTANSYAEGESEVLLGKALKGKRRDAVVATKFFNPMGSGANDSGMSRLHIMQAIEASLQRLEMEYVDLYYIHHVDVQTPLEEMLRAMDDLVRRGKVRYIACSNYEAWRLCDALWTSEANGLARFECYQPQYSLVVRDVEQELIPLCLAKQLGVVVWSPLAGGFLTGKYTPGQRAVSGSRSEEGWAYPEPYFADSADDTLRALLDVAKRAGCTPAAAAMGAGTTGDHIGDRGSAGLQPVGSESELFGPQPRPRRSTNPRHHLRASAALSKGDGRGNGLAAGQRRRQIGSRIFAVGWNQA